MEKIIALDFGGQYSQLIARRVRESGVYCELLPNFTDIEKLKDPEIKGIILTGGPSSVYAENAPLCNMEVFELGVPVLGICYGAQLLAQHFGGEVGSLGVSEYGGVTMDADVTSPLFDGVAKTTTVWMNHNDSVKKLPDGFIGLASTKNCPYAALSNADKGLYGIQFHPEVRHSECGFAVLKNFVHKICGCKGDWSMANLEEEQIKLIREQVGTSNVVSGLSGGVDSAVASVLVHKAIGKQLTCIFVDHGLLREGEAQEVLDVYQKGFGMNLVFVDARERFLKKLEGVSDPERKRKIIGEEFIRVFEEEASKVDAADFLVQGTIYPDVIESGGSANAAVIKSHHNVGGLPEDTRFKAIIEPLRSLFKDEVRALGTQMGIPDEQVWRQPFPGPGLAIRVLGDITEEKLEIVRTRDLIRRHEVAAAGLTRDIWQYFTVFTPLRTVGVMGDDRTYDHVVAVRAVTSDDAMTVDFAKIPYDVLGRISNRIINEVKGVNRVVYDITSKPPGTIEWE